MSDWVWISVIFGLLALVSWVYDPKMLVEHEDGSVTYEHIDENRPTLLERVRVIFAIALVWAVVIVIVYHELVWGLLQEYVKVGMV